MRTAPINIRLPEKINEILDDLALELHVTETQLFMLPAIFPYIV